MSSTRPNTHDVPYSKRKYLSPIYLHTSLGRSAGANPFVEYRSLVRRNSSSDKQAFAVDQSVMRECERLENKAITHPLIF